MAEVKNKKDSGINDGENINDQRPDYTELYKGDAWLYFEIE